MAKPSVGPFEVDQKGQWFKFVRGAVVPAEDPTAKDAKQGQS